MDAHGHIAERIKTELGARKSVHLEAQVAEYRSTIDRLTERNADATQTITENLRRMREQRDCLDIALAAVENDTFAAHLEEEWEQLVKHPRLADADIDGNELTLVTTDDIRLHCEDREETRWLGAFRMEIGLSNGSIKLHNISEMSRGGRDHPHVVDGVPCFGGDHQVFAQLLSNGHLNVLFEMLLQYLEKLNLEDEYGRFGAFWFEQEDERPLNTNQLEMVA